jgi:hypothetical protein
MTSIPLRCPVFINLKERCDKTFGDGTVFLWHLKNEHTPDSLAWVIFEEQERNKEKKPKDEELEI